MIILSNFFIVFNTFYKLLIMGYNIYQEVFLMINRNDNPDYLNAFLDYTLINLNKSPNSVKEYNYDLANFLRYIKQKYCTLSEDEKDFKKIIYKDVPFEVINKVKLSDIRSYLSILRTSSGCKATDPCFRNFSDFLQEYRN